MLFCFSVILLHIKKIIWMMDEFQDTYKREHALMSSLQMHKEGF